MDTLEEMFAALEVRPSEHPTQIAHETGEQSPSSLAVEGCFENASDAMKFIMAGNSTLTLVSKKSGERFTYRVRSSEDGNVHFVALLNGPDNESQYAYFGYVRRGVFFYGGRKAKVAEDRPSVRGFAWTFRHLSQGVLPESVEVWHEDRCGRCGRKLTVPSSISRGFGPECAGKVA